LRPPGYWMQEVGGELIPAVKRYLEGTDPLSVRDVALIRAYLVQWIDSPVWDLNPYGNDSLSEELKELRRAAPELRNRRQIEHWVEVAADWGMDPL